MKTKSAQEGVLIEVRAFGPRRSLAERLVLTLTTLGMIAALVTFISYQEARSQFTQDILPSTPIPRSLLYYVSYAIQIVLLVSAGLVASLSTDWRTIKQGYLLGFILLLGAALVMTVRGYSFSDLLSTKLLDESGPFPFFISVLVFVGAQRKNWVVLGKGMVILGVLLSALVLLRLAGLQVFTRAEGVGKLTGILNALFWPASWIALQDYRRGSLACRLRSLPMVIFCCGSFFTQTRLYFVMIFAFLAVYSYLQRKRGSPQAITWVVGLTLAVWISLFTAIFLMNTRAFERVSNVADAFSSRLDEDTRTGQLEWFFESVRPHELLLGRGSFAGFYWKSGEYNGGPDVGYLSMLFFGGVPLLVTYLWTHVMPCLAVLRKHSTDWRLAAAGVVVLWGIRMLSSSYPGPSLEYYPILFCVGACISRESTLHNAHAPIRIPANENLERDIAELVPRPVGRPSIRPLVEYKSFLYQAASWKKARRVVAKVEHHQGELFPRVGFIVTNLSLPSRAAVRFYNKRGTAEQWIKEGKQAVKMTRLSCHRFRANEVRLWLSLIAYNLG